MRIHPSESMSTSTGSASTEKSLLRDWSRSWMSGYGRVSPVFLMNDSMRSFGKKSVLTPTISSPWAA